MTRSAIGLALLLLGCSLLPPAARGEGFPVPSRAVPEDSVTTLFGSHAPIRFVLSADFQELGQDRDQDSEDRPGTIGMEGVFGQRVEIPIQVRTRGRFRLQDRICPDPPLRLNFPKSTFYGTIFDGQDKLKLVTHCQDSDAFEQNLLEEFLAYRIYNQLTDVSFRVHLAEITYVDTSGENDPVERKGFLIEDEDALADRLGGEMVEITGVLPNQYDLRQIGLMYLFDFLVGNVDWGTGTGHNVKIFKKDEVLFPVPYDFDFSGLVDAPYARPSPLTEPLHDSVRERVYWGVCMPGVDYEGLFAHFNAHRDAVLALPYEKPGLTEENLRSAVEYLEEFYRIINDPDRADREIISACRPWL